MNQKLEKLVQRINHSRMTRENVTICDFCGAEKQGLSFFIGASNTPDWTMGAGTGKMCCPDCHQAAAKEGAEAVLRAGLT